MVTMNSAIEAVNAVTNPGNASICCPTFTYSSIAICADSDSADIYPYVALDPEAMRIIAMSPQIRFAAYKEIAEI